MALVRVNVVAGSSGSGLPVLLAVALDEDDVADMKLGVLVAARGSCEELVGVGEALALSLSWTSLWRYILVWLVLLLTVSSLRIAISVVIRTAVVWDGKPALGIYRATRLLSL